MGDEIDAQLLPLFLEESVDLMRAIGEDLRDWRAARDNNTIAQRLQRELHTLKGSARMTGAMGCGELLHSMESRIEQAVAMKAVSADMLDSLETSYDRTAFLIERLRRGEFITAETTPTPVSTDDVRIETAADLLPDSTPDSATTAVDEATLEATLPLVASTTTAVHVPQIQQTHLRVRADLVDRLVNEAGEVAIARGRMEGEMRALKASLLELTENVIRLRSQVREIEIQAETQMQAQMSQLRAKAEQDGTQFDPLELDRFTRFQELTRMMAESVNDVSTVQHSLLKNLDSTNASLAAQARLNRELSQRLMSVRMVPFDTLAERLHRVVRQAAKDCGKRANLDIRGGQTGIDRSVLERIGAPLEHLLRNSVAHGIETPTERDVAGKDALGQITVSLAQEGNEVVIGIADDGNGLDFKRIRARALERGLLAADSVSDERELSALIFNSGFSTADMVTATSGRGVGMDVVKNEIEGLGGRIEISTTPGQGSNFRLYLPLTLAVSQAVIIQSGGLSYALPSSMIEQASELKPEAIAKIRLEGGTEWLGRHYDWHYLPRLMGDATAQPIPARRHWLLLVKGGSERAAIEIDGLVNNQEIVIKAIGPQLARVPGVSGATVLGDGEIALILNPIALVARAATRHAAAAAAHQTETVVQGLSDTQIQRRMAPQGCVMVVDDSLTVRKITGRLLGRQGYHVLTAKDGVDALEQLTEMRPDVMLVDIEMPRMDGFEFSRSVRADPKLRSIPIIMISSRTADKHRQYAQEIGVDHYLGKPYDEDRLLALVAGYTAHALIGKGNPA
jgi:chemosensory pili system protein ChpA (sensor histidine kinase/response regulator)